MSYTATEDARSRAFLPVSAPVGASAKSILHLATCVRWAWPSPASSGCSHGTGAVRRFESGLMDVALSGVVVVEAAVDAGAAAAAEAAPCR